MTDDLISRAAAVEVARRHRSKIEVNEPLWHEGQDWASDRIAEALAALPAAQVQAEPVPTPPAPDDMDALVKRLRRAQIDEQCNDDACHEAADAITALRASAGKGEVETSDGWHGIDTAPKDGSMVDLWHSAVGRVTNLRWDRGMWWRKRAPCELYQENFTHWRRQPDAPAALVASEPAPGSHQPQLPSEDAQQDTAGRATENRLLAVLQANLDAANADAERLAAALIPMAFAKFTTREEHAAKDQALAAHEARKGGA